MSFSLPPVPPRKHLLNLISDNASGASPSISSMFTLNLLLFIFIISMASLFLSIAHALAPCKLASIDMLPVPAPISVACPLLQ